MATYGNTGGNGLNINVYSGSGGNLSEWALDYDGLKLLTIPEVITASNITTNQTVTITLKAKPIFNNISVSFFRVKLPDGSIAEFPAINNTAIFTTPIAGALGSQQTLLVYARDNSGNRSAVASHLYTVVNSLPPSTSAITHNVPSSFSAGDVKQIQISGAVDPEGDPYTYSLILPPEISGSKISGIANNETVTLTVQNTIDYTKQDNIVIRVTDINGAQDDKVLTVTLLSGGSGSGGTNNFNVRTSFPSSVYPNEVFAAKIWELGTNNYTYGLNLPSGVTASKTMGILSNENFTVTIAPNVAPNSTIGIDVVVYTGNVSVGSFVVNMLVDGVTGETSYTTPGSYEFTIPNTVNSLSMLEVYSDKITESQLGCGGFVIENLKEENLRRGQNIDGLAPGNTPMQLNNMILAPCDAGLVYTLDNFTTINTVPFPPLHIYTGAYGNGSYIVSGDIVSGDKTESTMLSVNNGLSWNKIPTASVMDGIKHLSIDFFNSTFYIARNNITHDILVSIDGGYTFINKQMPQPYRDYTVWAGVVCNKDGYLRVMFDTGADKRAHLLRTIDRCNTWTEITIPDTTNLVTGYFKCINNRYMLISNIDDHTAKIIWSDDLLNWNSTTITLPTVGGVTTTGGFFGHDVIWFDGKYIFNNGPDLPYESFSLDANMQFIGYTGMRATGTTNNSHTRQLVVNGSVLFGHRTGINYSTIHKEIYLSAKSTDRINIDKLFGIAYQTNKVHFYNCNNEVVCLYDGRANNAYNSVSIKLTSPVNNVNGAYLTNDLSDKNVTVDHTVPNMNFATVAVSNNNLIAVNGNDNKVYKSTVGSKVWELVPNIVIDQDDVKRADRDGLNIHVFDNVVILNCPATKKMYYSNNSGDTWVSYSVTRRYYQPVIYRNTIYTLCDMGAISLGTMFSINLMTGEETQYDKSGTLIYVLNDVLILASGIEVNTGTTEAYYFNNNYTDPGGAFLPIMNYARSYPSNGYHHINDPCEDIVSRKNYSTKYTIGARYFSTIDIYDSTIKTISLDDIINNPIKSHNILTSGRKGITDGISNINNKNNVKAEYPQLRVYDDFIIYIKNHVFSVSTDGGSTFTSINTGSSIGDVIAHNGTLYIFSGNTVKKIVPSILDNSNIINKEPNIGYSLTNPKLAGNFGKNGYAKYLNNIEVTPGEKIKINVTSPDGGVRLVWGTNRYFPTNAS